MTTTSNSPLHIVRSSLTNVVALVHLAVCAGLLVWALTVSAGPDASFAGVIPLLATAPVSLVLLVLPEGMAMIIFAIALGALVNAMVIGWCVRALRQGRRPEGT